MHGARPSSIDVNIVGAKGRHLELETVFHHKNHAKVRAHRIGMRKEFLHSFRVGIGGDIEVFRSFTANDVAHAATGEVRDMAALTQTHDHVARRLFHRRFHLVGAVHRTAYLSCERRRLRSIAPTR